MEEYGDGSRKHWSKWNNAQECTANGGQWVVFSSYIEKAPRKLWLLILSYTVWNHLNLSGTYIRIMLKTLRVHGDVILSII